MTAVRMKKLTMFAVLMCCLVGSASAQQQIVFTPQWTAQAQFVGFYVAEAKGFYRNAGVNVRIQHPSPSNPCINQLKEGTSQLITLQLMTAMKTINEGTPIINVMQVLQNNSQMIVSHKPLKSIQDLKGKRVGCWKAGFVELSNIMNRHEHLNIEWVPFVSHVNLYISKAIDATTAQSYNEFFQLKMAGQRFQDSQLIYLKDIGYNIPEDGVYVTRDYYKAHKTEVDKFVKASKQGWEWAAKHPQEALDIVMEACRKYGVNTNRIAQDWMLKQILELTKDKKTGKITFRLDPDALALANRLMLSNDYLHHPVTYSQITEP